MATLALKNINREQLERNADWLAIAVAISLPWSTSATAILLVLWLIALVPTFRRSDLRREAPLTTLVGGLPVALWTLAVLGMLWSDVGLHERLSGLSGYHKLLTIPLLLAQFRRSDRARWVIVGFLGSCVALLLVSWLPTIIPSLASLAWRSSPGVPAKDYLTQSAIFQLCVFGLAYLAFDDWRGGRHRRALILAGLALLFFANIVYLASARTVIILMPVFVLLLGLRLFGWRGLVAATVAGIALSGIVWSSSANIRGQLTGLATVWTSPAYTHMQVTRLVNGAKLDPGDVDLASAGLRLEFYRRSIAIIGDAPILGHGTGTIRARFADVAIGKTGAAVITTGNPHQQTFAVGIQLGLLGVALLWAMWIVHLLLFRAEGIMAWCGLLVVLQNILGSPFNSHLFDFTQGWIYVFGVGVLGGALLRESFKPPLIS
ncbi:MAG: O-antigen ligase family protein [Rhizobiales bacterium]|nr:O-antigen ligase family protein [Hyphomicrobiales bacterium]